MKLKHHSFRVNASRTKSSWDGVPYGVSMLQISHPFFDLFCTQHFSRHEKHTELTVATVAKPSAITLGDAI